MRIVILTPNKDNRVGGIERFCQDLFEALSTRHDVFLVEPKSSSVPKYLRLLGLDNGWRTFKSQSQINALRPDLVITNRDMGFLFTRAARVHVTHGTMIAQKCADRRGRKLRDWLLRGVIVGGLMEYLSNVGSTKVAVSESAKVELKKYYLFRNVLVISNGVKIPKKVPHRNLRTRDLLFVGRPESRKGYEISKQIAQSLNLKLRVAGTSSDPDVESLGILHEQELQAEYESALGMLLPSKHEACSYAILEALSHGCPVFTTRIGWVIDLVKNVPEYSWMTVNLRKEYDLKDSILTAIREPELVQSTLAATKKWLDRNVSREIFNKKWLQLVEKLEPR